MKLTSIICSSEIKTWSVRIEQTTGVNQIACPSSKFHRNRKLEVLVAIFIKYSEQKSSE